MAILVGCSLVWTGAPVWTTQLDVETPVSEASGTLSRPGSDSSLEYEFVPVGSLPDWVEHFDAETADAASDGRRMLVSSGMDPHRAEASRELWNNAEVLVKRYLDERIAAGAGEALQVQRDYIQNHLTVPQHVHMHLYRTPNPLFAADGNEPEHLMFHCGWAELNFDNEFDEWAGARYEEHLVHSRVLQTALVLLSGIALLGIVYGFLHLNHRTRGFYSGRLQTITLLAVLVVVAVFLALSNSFPWL